MVKHFIALALVNAAAHSNSISRPCFHNSRLPVGLEHRSSSSLTLRRGALVRSGVVCTFLTGGALLSRALSKQEKKSASMTIIDSAVHVWKEDEGYPWAKEAAANPPAKDATAEELQTLMDANQVDKTVLIQPICYRYDNSFVKDTMRKYPDRFAAVARVDPEDVHATAQLEDLMAVGFKGVRFGPVEKSWWNSENMSSVLRKAEELEVPVLLFLGKDGGRSIPWIKPVLLKFPNLLVVIDHMADVPPTDPQQIDELLALASLPKIYVKLSHTWALSQQGYPWRDAQVLPLSLLALLVQTYKY
jgi:predicted TIM-barrel fold metal-dependent hydrolase